MTLSSTVADEAEVSAEVDMDGEGDFQGVTNGGDAGTITVTFIVGAAAQISLTGPDTMVAGEIAGPFTLQVLDQHGNKSVVTEASVFDLASDVAASAAFYSDSGGANAITQVTVAKDAGSATFYYSNSATGVQTVTATWNEGDANLEDKSAEQPIDVEIGSINAATSGVTADPDQVIANGVSTSLITVTVRNDYGIAISGVEVVLVGDDGGASTITAINGTMSDSNGVVTFNVKRASVGLVTYSATLDPGGLDVDVTETAEVQFVAQAPSAVASSATASSPHLADGVDASTLTITVLDADGVPVTDLEEDDFTFADQGNAEIDEFDATNAADGVYTFEVTNAVEEVVNVKVSARGVNLGTAGPISFSEELGVMLTAPAEVEATPGATAVVAFTVTNTGTASTAFELDLESEGLTWSAHVAPAGGAGAGTPVQDPFTLEPGESVEIQAKAVIPIDRTDGDVDDLTLTVRSTGSDPVTDTAEVGVQIRGPRLVATLTASAPETEPRPNDEITYRLTLKNEGSMQAEAVRISGPVPDGTEYVVGSMTVDGIGESALDTVIYEAAKRLATLGSVGPPVTLDPGEQLEFAYRVRVDAHALAGTLVSNWMRMTHRNAASVVYQQISDSVVVTIAPVLGVGVDAERARSAPPGGKAVFPIVVTNTGNKIDSFRVTTQLSGVSGVSAKWYRDADGDALVSPDDPPLMATGGDGAVVTSPMQAGASHSLLLELSLAGNVPLGSHEPVTARWVSTTPISRMLHLGPTAYTIDSR